MAADQYVVPAPPCQLCEQEEAIGSLQNLADWETIRFGPACAPGFLRAMADMIGGTEEQAAAEPETVTATVTGPPPEGMTVADVRAELEDDGEPGSKADHWASTTHVRRSTHGHRAPRRAAGKPREGEQE